MTVSIPPGPGNPGASVRFTVVTPSYNMLPYLKRCGSSIADQTPTHEHIVVDALSHDGTPEWLSTQPSIRAIVERDHGMYDAVNKGIDLARGEFVSYLNCDEQYLPGALSTVATYFDENPHVDVVFGDSLLINPDGELLAFRKGYQPRWRYVAVAHLYVLTCTMFLRRRILDGGARFDRNWKDVGDAEFVIRLLRSGARAAHIRRYLAAFTLTGSNMSAAPNARVESQRLRATSSLSLRWMSLPLEAARFVEKIASGAYHQRFPLEYSIYAGPDDAVRTKFIAASGTSRWPSA